MNIHSRDTLQETSPAVASAAGSARGARATEPDRRPVALVTGTSRGLGEAIANRLSNAGFQVFGTSRQPGPAASTWGRMLALDVRDAAMTANVVGEILRETGRIDLLVNNAGYPLTGAVEEITPEELRAQFETNLVGPLQMIRAVLPAMRARGTGRIVNISSAAGQVPLPFYGGYGASKAALERMSLSLRAEVRRDGIAVSCIAPSSHRTKVQHVLPAVPTATYDASRAAMVQAMETSCEQGGDPDRVARAVLKVARASRPPAICRVGTDARAFGVLLRLLPSSMIEDLIRRRFGLS
jgi:NAD(P)-dependent dehydrogenase (short-subunit alcohol dehydrogenase family)